jgi:hypothetical protein
VEGWHTLRHRKFLPIFREWGVSARIFIGESGNDDITERPGGIGKGYRDFVDWPHKQGDYADQLRWYCWQLSQDPEVIGVVDFGYAQGGDWASFDLGLDKVMVEKVITSQLTLPIGSFGGQPGPLAEPVPAPATDVRAALLDQADAHREIVLNPNAVLQQALFRDGFVPTSDEYTQAVDGADYVCQRAERLVDGMVRVYYVPKGRWDDVRFAERSGMAGRGVRLPPTGGGRAGAAEQPPAPAPGKAAAKAKAASKKPKSGASKSRKGG